MSQVENPVNLWIFVANKITLRGRYLPLHLQIFHHSSSDKQNSCIVCVVITRGNHFGNIYGFIYGKKLWLTRNYTGSILLYRWFPTVILRLAYCIDSCGTFVKILTVFVSHKPCTFHVHIVTVTKTVFILLKNAVDQLLTLNFWEYLTNKINLWF